MDKTVAAHHGCIKAAFTPTQPPAQTPAPPLPDAHLDVRGRPRVLAARTAERYQAVQELVAAGRSLRGISRDLQLDYYAVRRYARATSLDELIAPAVHRRSVLDAFKPYIYERFTEGQRNAVQLYREVRQQGYSGSASTVNLYVHLLKRGVTAPPAPRPIPAPRSAATLLLTHPDRLPPEQTGNLHDVQAACPHLTAAGQHVRAFAKMLTNLTGQQHLSEWIDSQRSRRRPAPPAAVRRRTPNRLRRRPRRPLHTVEIRPGRRTEHPGQAGQTPRLRPRELRPAPQTDPASSVRHRHKISDRAFGCT
ncbi:hypothetical protein [Micromonospora chalcea]|uniref:hypothetical protein n=1 Tax=Micromonospora chalcea TaxID=1874 RepID=UPI003B983DBA